MRTGINAQDRGTLQLTSHAARDFQDRDTDVPGYHIIEVGLVGVELQLRLRKLLQSLHHPVGRAVIT